VPGKGQRKLRKVRRAVRRRDALIAQLRRAQRRLNDLYEISKRLLSFQSLDRTVPEVLQLLAKTVTFTSAILIVETDERVRTKVWQTRGNPAGLTAARANVRKVYADLARTQVDLSLDEQRTLQLPGKAPAAETPNGNRLLVLPLVEQQGRRIFGALQLECSGEVEERDLDFINAAVNQLALAIDRQVAITARERLIQASAREQRLLAEVSAEVGASLDCRAVLDALARFAVAHLAESCVVEELTDDGSVQRVAVAFKDPKKEALKEAVLRFAPRAGWRTIDARAIATGRPVLVSHFDDPLAEDIAHDPEHAELIRALGIETLMSLPLLARGRTVGAVVFGAGAGRRYGPSDLTLAEQIAGRAAVAIDNAHLFEQAQRATELRDSMLAIVSHDLKNPLAAIMMNVGELQLGSNKVVERRQSRKQLDSVVRSANRMTRMIDDLLDSASIEKGRLSLQPEPIEATALLSEVRESLAPIVGHKGQQLVVEVPVDLPTVFADPARVHRVFDNLVGNALKFGMRGATVTLTACALENEVCFSVGDIGRGISADDLPRIFDRFYRVSAEQPGAGLGLYIVKGIVEAHGGSVWAESTLGKGSTFHFTLPAARRG
jgi:signal transduction histidine kinase